MKEAITNPGKVVPLLKTYSTKKLEHFGIICLDAGNRVISKKALCIGGEYRTLIEAKAIFWEAFSKKASCIILFHNHPSGNAEPSKEDLESTEKLLKACAVVGLPLLDHIIITKNGYYSFCENGKVDIDFIASVAEV